MIQVPDIEDSFEQSDTYPSVTERYYTPYFYLNKNGPLDEHHCILLHSNKICLITLAPTHPVIKYNKKIKKLDFEVTSKIDRLENKVVGKGKKGGQFIQPDSTLCFLECEDGTKYSIYGCVKGKLVEINQLLTENYDLLLEKPTSMGFIAIILPNKKEMNNVKDTLISREDYEKAVLSS